MGVTRTPSTVGSITSTEVARSSDLATTGWSGDLAITSSTAPLEGSREQWIEPKRRRIRCSCGQLPVASCRLAVGSEIERDEAGRQVAAEVSGS
jgi:hypothetical protein